MNLDVIILAGGFGTRLQSISNGIPKSLMPIGDGVYLDFLVENIFKYNINHIYLSVSYKSEHFFDYISKSELSEKLKAVVEPEPLGTGGAINYVINNSSISQSFFVINGDSISNIKFDLMMDKFVKRNLKAMLGISKVKDTNRYGTITEKDGKVISFNEKGISGPGWINNGHYIFKKEVFNKFSGKFSLEKEFFPKFIKKNDLDVFRVTNDCFIDMGIPADYIKLKERLLKI